MSRAFAWAFAAWATVMYALTFLHLQADFPYRSPWSDWSKATDEGWYGGGALHHFVFGHWYLPNAFNPAVAMPAWPVMLGGWFSVAGVGMAQARALTVLLYGASLLLLLILMREARCSWAVCTGAVLLIAANPFCYVFDRLAVLEPVTVFWWLLALWLAARTRSVWRAVLLGVLCVVLVWTKTTAVVMILSILYLLYASAKRQGRPWKWPAAVTCGTAAVVWATYFLAWVRPRYLRDFRFVFAINAYRIHTSIVPQMTYRMFRDGFWINAVLFPVGMLMLLAAAVWLRRLWREPLLTAAVIALATYMAFILYHGNFQPRYYLVAAWPMVLVVAMGVEEMWRRGSHALSMAVAGVLLATAVWMTVGTLRYVTHPQYGYRNMADAIARMMRAEGGSPVLLSSGGDDISLFTGVRAISQYQPNGMEALLTTYQPRWIAGWMSWDRPLLEQVAPYYDLQLVATFHVYDDEPFHQEFVVYRMTPKERISARR